MKLADVSFVARSRSPCKVVHGKSPKDSVTRVTSVIFRQQNSDAGAFPMCTDRILESARLRRDFNSIDPHSACTFRALCQAVLSA